jgi:hypothetical protein
VAAPFPWPIHDYVNICFAYCQGNSRTQTRQCKVLVNMLGFLLGGSGFANCFALGFSLKVSACGA